MHLNGRQRYSFGLFATLLALAAFSATFAGCTKKNSIAAASNSTAGQRDSSRQSLAVKYLALGDSYTIGQSVPESASYPNQLAKTLAAAGINMQQPKIIATTGWTTQDLLAAIQTQAPAKDYDIVTLLIGVNNQYRQHDTIGYRAQFELCLQKAIEHAGGNRSHVFVISIPDYGVTSFGQSQNPAMIATQIDQYNAINRSVTEAYGISYTNITPASRLALNDPSLTSPDGLHPSEKEYAVWVDMLAPKIRELLK